MNFNDVINKHARKTNLYVFTKIQLVNTLTFVNLHSCLKQLNNK